MRQRTRVPVSALLALLVVLLALAAPAAAHTDLAGTSPREGTVVDRLLREVRLSFDEPLSSSLVQVAVIAPDGTDVVSGKPTVDGGSVVASLRGLDVPGRYRVAYRVVAADGHPETGGFRFTLSEAAASTRSSRATAAVLPTGSGSQSSDLAASPASGASGPWLAVSVALAGLLVSAVLARFTALRRTRPDAP